VEEGLKSLINQIMFTDVERLGEFLRSFEIYAWAIAMLATLLQACFPFVPFIVIAGANVLVFGLFYGMLISYLMSVVGACCAFLFARYIGRDWVTRRLKRYKAAERLNRQLTKNGFSYVLMARIAFIIPSIAVNWVCGLSRMKFTHFAAATLIGKLPVVVLESMLGHDLLHLNQNKPRLIILVLLFIGFAFVSRMIQRKLTARS